MLTCCSRSGNRIAGKRPLIIGTLGYAIIKPSPSTVLYGRKGGRGNFPSTHDVVHFHYGSRFSLRRSNGIPIDRSITINSRRTLRIDKAKNIKR